MFQDSESQKPKHVDSWKAYFESAYIWFDFISMPQPTAYRYRGDTDDRVKKADKKLRLAASSVASYIDNCDLMLVLAPSVVLKSSTGERRIVDFSTWRSRGWCMLEMICWQFNVGSIRNAIVVSDGYNCTPYRLSKGYVLNIQPLMANFTCCEIGIHDDHSKGYCDRNVARKTIHAIIDRKFAFGIEVDRCSSSSKFNAVSMSNMRNYKYLMALKGHYCRDRLTWSSNTSRSVVTNSSVSSDDEERSKTSLQLVL